MKKLSEYSFADLDAMWKWLASRSDSNSQLWAITKKMTDRINNTDFSPVAESNTITNTNPSKTT